MSQKIEQYRQELVQHKDRRQYLLDNSGLPGPRANIDLAHAFAMSAGQALIYEYADIPVSEAPVNTPEEFLTFCGVLGLGRLILERKELALEKLRKSASDERWRTREAVAMALQIIGQYDMDRLLHIADEWSEGNCYEQRAAAASICEPDLLWDPHHAKPVFEILDRITASVDTNKSCSTQGFNALKKGLAYCWSVAVAAYPDVGKPAMENWFTSHNSDIIWIMKQNLKKNRLERMDSEWVQNSKGSLNLI